MHRFLVVVTVGQQVEASAAVAALDDRQHFRGQPLQLAPIRNVPGSIRANFIPMEFVYWSWVGIAAACAATAVANMIANVSIEFFITSPLWLYHTLSETFFIQCLKG